MIARFLPSRLTGYRVPNRLGRLRGIDALMFFHRSDILWFGRLVDVLTFLMSGRYGNLVLYRTGNLIRRLGRVIVLFLLSWLCDFGVFNLPRRLYSFVVCGFSGLGVFIGFSLAVGRDDSVSYRFGGPVGGPSGSKGFLMLLHGRLRLGLRIYRLLVCCPLLHRLLMCRPSMCRSLIRRLMVGTLLWSRLRLDRLLIRLAPHTRPAGNAGLPRR